MAVTPLMGVWIETYSVNPLKSLLYAVTPLMGVWIETLECLTSFHKGVSHPSWVCGLKHLISLISIRATKSHTPHGCVD